MAATVVDWACKECGKQFESGHKVCDACPSKPMLHYECLPTGKTGAYTNWYSHHRADCHYCSPERGKQIERDVDSKAEDTRKLILEPSHGTNRYLLSSLSCSCRS
jgi:hypothetical protein